MILDSIKSFEKYVNLHASFGKVLEFIRKNDLHTLPEGKHVIEEDNIWCTISTARCKDERLPRQGQMPGRKRRVQC